mmetsp:Transcript_34694/g.80995  ORF Transcript_34694/g.80995 Transcript_34694/m.80995 type:complete len:290 (-) Transcript_34694:193-1062(-)|eukprot:CAMPEP_0178421024 /NCGR_PEP_ID=MMETSP0689_2-20121128/26437_1 /TAXON_ID=160604 /ORGANISM="Amphidinium massartii, Strain CS-259" /LENGTH=289 /DNA_ID=CAMNT_0020042529 /DNA_START=1 /DNA_END=870 /DNA_ORIENTATION=+
MAIDVWAQPLRREFFASLPEVSELAKKSGSAFWIERFAANADFEVSVDETVAMMDRAGVDRVFMCAWHGPKGAIISNDVIASFVEKYPDRFVGICAVDITKPSAAVKELEYYVKQKGFKGVRVVPWLWSMAPTTNYFYPIFAKCVELDVPFMTQVGHTGPLYPSDTGRPIPHIDRIALDFPDLKIICGHIGYPWTDEMIAVAWKHENVYIDTSAYAPKFYPAQLLQYMKTYGKHKVMFGTNFPQLSWDQCHRQAKQLPLGADEMKMFLSGNAERVFRLSAPPPAVTSKL